MLKYCRDVIKLTERFGKNYEAFRDDMAYRYSISMAVYQVGELSNHLTEEFKANHSDIPWRIIRGMRNWFAHNYYGMDIIKIWEAAADDIPELAEFCKKVLAEQEKN